MKAAKHRKTITGPFFVPIISLIAVIVIVLIGHLVLDDYVVIRYQGQHYPVLAKNNNLKIELVTSGLSYPTNMVFIDQHNILVLEKNTGAIRLITDGVLKQDPILKLSVAGQGERGLLGLAVLNNTSAEVEGEKDKKSEVQSVSSLSPAHPSSSRPESYVFLYFTELKKNSEAKNVVYTYEWDGKSLRNAKMIWKSPSNAGIFHNGGKMIIGPRDHQLYVAIGDLNTPDTVMQNYKYGKKSSHSSVILRINPLTGLPSAGNPFLNSNNNDNDKIPGSSTDIVGLDYIYAYGIRNSFGLAFDPITGFLWDTENGENTFDEINLVKPGFNSGWDKIMGPISRNKDTSTKSKLVDLPGSYYSDPKFSWRIPIGVTAIEFFNSSNFGTKYKDNIFIGDINNGNIYYFKVNNTNRTDLNLDNGRYSGLVDHVAENKKETLETLFATNFEGRITDIKTGPDGNLYVLTYFDGKLYKIMPA